MRSKESRSIPSWSGDGVVVSGRARLSVIDRVSVVVATIAANAAIVFVASAFGPPNRRVCTTYANLTCGSRSSEIAYAWLVFGVFAVWVALSCLVVRWRWPRAWRIVAAVQGVALVAMLISTLTT